jgi:hypothetical protein
MRFSEAVDGVFHGRPELWIGGRFGELEADWRFFVSRQVPASFKIGVELLVYVLRHPLVDVYSAGRALLFPQRAVFDAIDVGDRATRIGGVIDDVVPLALQARGLGLFEILLGRLGAGGRVPYGIVVGRLLCPLDGVGGARTGAALRT